MFKTSYFKISKQYPYQPTIVKGNIYKKNWVKKYAAVCIHKWDFFNQLHSLNIVMIRPMVIVL